MHYRRFENVYRAQNAVSVRSTNSNQQNAWSKKENIKFPPIFSLPPLVAVAPPSSLPAQLIVAVDPVNRCCSSSFVVAGPVNPRYRSNEAQLILDYLYGLFEIGHVEHKRKKNISLGHLVVYILDKKYNLVHPNQEFEEPLYYNDGSFRAIFSKDELSKTHVISDTEEEHEAAPAPVNDPNYQNLVQRFDLLKTHFNKRFDQIEAHMQQQDIQYAQDMGFMREQMNDISTNVLMMSTYFNIFGAPPPPHPPLDQGPSE
ncbi:hypothetical protein MA16_Dca014959 [Dendrobium catenatum]|uniref:Uncharacterized protein n=1 Tax=Dendrobium catenatum TaxID=906689 RepID=A0A2I0V9H9_9ASPA|nr:hypothetical protein MA16_Dca014959 [Dendrobium catenatum]